jgi:beta-glucosidase
MRYVLNLILVCSLPCLCSVACSAESWNDRNLSPDQRADLVLAEMTSDEKLQWVFGYFGADLPSKNYTRPAQSRPDSAGFIPGISRLGIPALFETDAGLGVATQSSGKEHPLERTELPSGLATAATWNADLAYASGVMIGAEARSSGFNVMLAGGVNLVREPRNGRNFEYAGEDPLLAGVMVAQQIKGIESNHLIATMKHYALNAQETGRAVLDAQIDEAGLRMSDLLAMQLVIEQANPGAVMCAYNRVNSRYACENNFLLNTVLKGDWGYQGFVMSDWGAVHSTVDSANHGLDQESGSIFDDQPYFAAPLKAAIEQGAVSQKRLDDMVRRILRSMFAKGVVDYPLPENSTIDFAAHAIVSRTDAEEGMVLLKNRHHLLPLQNNAKKILIIGGHADVGVLSGGGSSQVYPVGGIAVHGLEPGAWPGPVVYFPSSPLRAIQALASQSLVSYDDGSEIQVTARAAAQADRVIIFATQWIGEANDALSLDLPDPQNELIRAVAAVNPNTIVVLETGGPVTMPWINQVGAVLEAWYPGSSGGEAIARILFGVVNPSGHLPVTFPESELQLVRSRLDGDVQHQERPLPVNYREGAAVGYKWLDSMHVRPLFTFGFGLSFTEFIYTNLHIACQKMQCRADFLARNSGTITGKTVPQIYVSQNRSKAKNKWEAPRRLVGWKKIELAPGEMRRLTIDIDPRFLATFDVHKKQWHVDVNNYLFRLAHCDECGSDSIAQIALPETTLDMQGHELNSH